DLAIARQFVTAFCRPLGLVSSLRLYSGSRAFFLLVSYSLSSQLAFSGLLSAGCDRVPESDKATEEPVDLALLPDCHYRLLDHLWILCVFRNDRREGMVISREDGFQRKWDRSDSEGERKRYEVH